MNAKAAAVYGAVAFVVFQAADLIFSALHVPEWAFSLVVVGGILGAVYDPLRIRFDMEASTHTQKTLDFFRGLWREGYRNIGVVIQSYLRRSQGDIEQLDAGLKRSREAGTMLGETLVALGFLLRIHHELYGGQKRLVQRGYVR